VAAHSTTRALFGSYSGPLYQVRRSSDNTTLNISPLSAGGVANAAAQDSFCAGTSCVITEIFDQTGRGNNLTRAPGGGAAGCPDNLASGTAAKISVGGHEAYGVFVAPGTGYRGLGLRHRQRPLDHGRPGKRPVRRQPPCASRQEPPPGPARKRRPAAVSAPKSPVTSG
jgi:Alpha-L-arabinofuranosidase B, catalytic